MNAGGVLNTCKSNGVFGHSGARVSNAWVIYPRIGDNIAKVMLIPNEILKIHVFGIKDGLYM